MRNTDLSEVKFKFNLEDKVTTALDDKGIITTAAVDTSGVMYAVQTKTSREWHPEHQLTLIAE